MTKNQGNNPGVLSRTEHAHQLFRGAAELAKWLRRTVLGLEVLAAMIAACGALSGKTLWSGWASLVILLLMLCSIALRICAQRLHGYSERCRRVSAKAHAHGEELGAAVHSGLASDAPPLAERLARMLPASNLSEYYEATKTVGRERIQEIYAHSAFYSWRLLRRGGWLSLLTGLGIGAVGCTIVYGMALPSTQISTADKILDVVCSLVFAALAAKSMDAASAAFFAAHEARTIAEGLIATNNTALIDELVVRYDMERASGPPVPTFVYVLSRTKLQAEWHQRRQALDEINPQ